jgi:hypothetical protein
MWWSNLSFYLWPISAPEPLKYDTTDFQICRTVPPFRDIDSW